MPNLRDPLTLPVILACLALSALAHPIHAQIEDAMGVGSLIRVHTSDFSVLGDVSRLSESGVTLARPGRDPLSVEWSQVSRLEMSTVNGHSAKGGALIGFVGGMAFAVLVAARNETGDDLVGWIAAGTLVFALPAAAVGALIGRFTPRRGWTEIPVPGSGP
jgi:hypothetical protein